MSRSTPSNGPFSSGAGPNRSAGEEWPAMKLALVSPYDFAYPGGVTEHVANLAEQFIRAGHQVHIVAPSSDDETEPIASVAAPIHRIGRVVSIPANGSDEHIPMPTLYYMMDK